MCNYNQVRKSYALKNELLNQVSLASSELTKHLSTIDFTNLSVLIELNKLNMATLMLEGSHQIKDTFGECKFQGISLNCSEYMTRVLTDFGYCFQFNSRDFVENQGRYVGVASEIINTLSDIIINLY